MWIIRASPLPSWSLSENKYLLSDFYVPSTEKGTGDKWWANSCCLGSESVREKLTNTKYTSHTSKYKTEMGKSARKEGGALCYYRNFTSTERSLELNSEWWLEEKEIKGKDQTGTFQRELHRKREGAGSILWMWRQPLCEWIEKWEGLLSKIKLGRLCSPWLYRLF